MVRAVSVAVALSLTGCSDSPPPVTAEKVLDVPGLQAVVNAVALSPDGSVVAVGDLDGDLVTREVPSGAERWKVRVHARGAARRIDGLVFSQDGSLLASTGHDARTVELWSWPALSLRASVSMSKSLEPMAPVSLALGRQGTRRRERHPRHGAHRGRREGT